MILVGLGTAVVRFDGVVVVVVGDADVVVAGGADVVPTTSICSCIAVPGCDCAGDYGDYVLVVVAPVILIAPDVWIWVPLAMVMCR
jgi:hypothetical protein